MATQFLAVPRWVSGDPLVAATEYAERFADHEEAQDRAAGLPPACSAAARANRIAAMTEACLRYWQRQRDLIDAEFGGSE
jgi:hypothetical protein